MNYLNDELRSGHLQAQELFLAQAMQDSDGVIAEAPPDCDSAHHGANAARVSEPVASNCAKWDNLPAPVA